MLIEPSGEPIELNGLFLEVGRQLAPTSRRAAIAAPGRGAGDDEQNEANAGARNGDGGQR
ncbi:MAG TPA: hypothetical protein VM674_07720 [Candidatus Acidoferrum sp.]|nr:hypothetical protein [Candidatus Acidoferrum sp.]